MGKDQDEDAIHIGSSSVFIYIIKTLALVLPLSFYIAQFISRYFNVEHPPPPHPHPVAFYHGYFTQIYGSVVTFEMTESFNNILFIYKKKKSEDKNICYYYFLSFALVLFLVLVLLLGYYLYDLSSRPKQEEKSFCFSNQETIASSSRSLNKYNKIKVCSNSKKDKIQYVFIDHQLTPPALVNRKKIVDFYFAIIKRKKRTSESSKYSCQLKIRLKIRFIVDLIYLLCFIVMTSAFLQNSKQILHTFRNIIIETSLFIRFCQWRPPMWLRMMEKPFSNPIRWEWKFALPVSLKRLFLAGRARDN
eukprot:gene7391-5204_t